MEMTLVDWLWAVLAAAEANPIATSGWLLVSGLMLVQGQRISHQGQRIRDLEGKLR